MVKITREKDAGLIGQGYIPTRKVKERYDISEMSLWRWLDQPNSTFPKPYIFFDRKYWKVEELEEWERKAPRAARVPKRVAA